MSDAATDHKGFATLHLTVNNHPGVMSHVCGLFARRAYNLEGILVVPAGADATCEVWLLVNEDDRIDQVVSQVRKLHDVLKVDKAAVSEEAFGRLAACLRA